MMNVKLFENVIFECQENYRAKRYIVHGVLTC